MKHMKEMDWKKACMVLLSWIEENDIEVAGRDIIFDAFKNEYYQKQLRINYGYIKASRTKKRHREEVLRKARNLVRAAETEPRMNFDVRTKEGYMNFAKRAESLLQRT